MKITVEAGDLPGKVKLVTHAPVPGNEDTVEEIDIAAEETKDFELADDQALIVGRQL